MEKWEQSWSYDENIIEIYSWRGGGLRNGGTLFKIGAFIHVLIHIPLGLLLGYVNFKFFLLKHKYFKYQNSYTMTVICFELYLHWK